MPVNNMTGFIRNVLKRIILPGTDLFTRRRTALEKNWMSGERNVLDAGFGNGWFSFRAYRSGAKVTAVAIQPVLLTRAREFYNGFLDISESDLNFQNGNLYTFDAGDGQYDEIICYETLEHIRDDEKVCRNIYRWMKPGGVLHLCCPNAEHPRWASEILDEEEKGGHVRYGYTVNSYRELLEPIGYQLEVFEGVGGGFLVFLQEVIQAHARKIFGEPGALLVAMLSIPFIWFDSRNPSMPFSIYVKAVKPGSEKV